MPRMALTALVCLLSVVPSVAGEIRVYPPTVHISGPVRSQQLVVVEVENGRVVRDRTAEATFASSNTSIPVDAAGWISAKTAGQATITVTVQGQKATVEVTAGDSHTNWNFRNHVLPTLTRAGCNMGACHGALAGKGGMKLSLRGYDPESDWFVLTRQAVARRVDLRRPNDSLLLKKATRSIPHGGGTRFEEGSPHYQLLVDWLKAGAPGPQESDPVLERLEVFPQAILVPAHPAKDSPYRIIVRATYSDGTQEDVTPWARFASSEELVVQVDDEGRITPRGQGEAAITVNFGTKVALVTVTAPWAQDVAAEVFRQSPRHNYIDDHILRKLELLRIPPSGPCTDAEFIRRVYLDTCGILPAPAEVEAFLKDTNPQKRSQLIDRLLDHPAFVDYWSHKWSDLLLVSTRKLAQPAMWAFYRTIRHSVANNQPWDRFARDILTATGSTLIHGGGNYFVLHKDVSELAETTAVTFMGLSINCAKCHNHPLEKWTQDQYWAFANLFARIALKNGERRDDVIVQNKHDGEVLHLRRGVPMPPTPLGGKPLPIDSPRDRREYFVAWLTAPDNPYFAKAIINRVWRNYMGRGLVEPEDDLRETNPPSHPELLDALAADLVQHHYDLKYLMRLILNSAAYQRSSQPLPGNAADDRFYSRYLIRRLPAEVILDAYSDVTGVPTPFDKINSAAGDDSRPINTYPLGTRAIQIPDSLVTSRFLDAFGRAERVQSCACERSSDSSVTQALHLNNGYTLNDKLRDKNSVVGRWLADNWSNEKILDELFLRALARRPTPTEKTKLLALLEEGSNATTRREAIEDLVWAVLTGREFLFNH
ncbi:MAG: DUF1553 domain-containing protein [Gemmataceae bacterium]|nr:DUF1553 domain-containing protein [Gemmata sp.]MDW8199274.1 DUF1553 domain-containing protein [Gemmataceae bacterium]